MTMKYLLAGAAMAAGLAGAAARQEVAPLLVGEIARPVIASAARGRPVWPARSRDFGVPLFGRFARQ